MKRLVACLLAAALCVPMCLCGCDTNVSGGSDPSSATDTKASSEDSSSDTTEDPTEDTSEDTAVSSEDTDNTSSGSTDMATETYLTLESVYVSDLWEDYSFIESEFDTVYHVPFIDLESEDAEQINSEIHDIMEGPSEDFRTSGHAHMCASRYVVYITDSNLMTVVFSLEGEWGDDEYYMWTVNLDTGDRLSNSEIAEAAGIGDIRASAMYALDRYFEAMNLAASGGTVTRPDFINGELNPDGPNYRTFTGDAALTEAAAVTYSEDTLNDDMTIGLDADSRLIFSSPVVSLAGASSYNRCYDSEGVMIDFGDYEASPSGETEPAELPDAA